MKFHVLIVDDEPDVATYLSIALEAHGFDASVAYDVTQAAVLLDQHRPDLICLDIMMPRQSGLSFYSKLRTDPKWAEIPVVLVSGIASEKDFDFGELAHDESLSPPNGFLEKPVQIDKFLEVVSKVITAGKSPLNGAKQ